MDVIKLSEKFLEIREHSLTLASPLKAEDSVIQPIFYVSPPKWHLAHTTWFFEELILKEFQPDYDVYNSGYSFLFNSYYNTVGDRTIRSDRGNISRPTLDEILEYRNHVEDALVEFITQDMVPEKAFELVQLGMQHEQQHQELFLADLKYTLGLNPSFPIYHEHFNLTSNKNEESGYVSIEDGIHEVGYTGKGFCFDNELNPHKVYLDKYEISKALITNGEFLEFIEAGGYENFNNWLDEGWTWVKENNITSPLHWHYIEGKWHCYTLSGLVQMKSDDILTHISYYEAAAFAFWKEMRLPTEFEWEVASKEIKWGLRWEWTNSAYLPYPGFKINKGAVGEYNGKFMINQMVLRGGSVATSKKHSRNTYRNFFHPYFQWQYTGIRLAK